LAQQFSVLYYVSAGPLREQPPRFSQFFENNDREDTSIFRRKTTWVGLVGTSHVKFLESLHAYPEYREGMPPNACAGKA